MKKIVNLDHRAKKEISSFPVQARLKIAAVLEILEKTQKTPLLKLSKAKKRLKEHLKGLL